MDNLSRGWGYRPERGVNTEWGFQAAWSESQRRGPQGPPPPGGVRAPSARRRGDGPPWLTVSWSERTTSRTGTETLPRLLREAAVEDHSQWAEA